MPHNFTIYRVLCVTTPELAAEQGVFLSTLAQFAEQVSMPEWILFAPGTFRPPFDANASKSAVESNIGMCDFFLQIFGDKVPEPVYRGFLDYALECTADASKPMRQATALVREFESVSEEMQALRKSLESDARCDVRAYGGANDGAGNNLEAQLRGIFQDWYAQVRSAALPKPGKATAQGS
jgi:hypothetical protein